MRIDLKFSVCSAHLKKSFSNKKNYLLSDYCGEASNPSLLTVLYGGCVCNLFVCVSNNSMMQ